MDGIALCALAMQDAQRRLESATVTLSNAETDGFTQHVAGHTLPAHEALRATGQPLDFAVSGPGALHVAPPGGGGFAVNRAVALRNAAFHRDSSGYIVDERGRALLGRDGPLHVPPDAQFRSDGAVVSAGTVVARVALAPGTELHSGFTLGSNVNSIGEMIKILDAQRSFETAQKTLSAVDAARQKATTDVGKMQ